MMTISFPKLVWRNYSDQNKVESFCNSLQTMVLDRIRKITDPKAGKDFVLESEDVARIVATDWPHSVNKRDSVPGFGRNSQQDRHQLDHRNLEEGSFAAR